MWSCSHGCLLPSPGGSGSRRRTGHGFAHSGSRVQALFEIFVDLTSRIVATLGLLNTPL
jgi:hypothetical protein